ncbi:hypothetical protein SAMN05421848_1384 [Kushneria avicenniae]|uniref:Uncharacterized protein n=1 Tax=Kushneria avicenniae TaxID=402385 RepID=A0A1I1J745_9GAMM|nr:hypothetical protein [Kushneria avicenniae]SFC44407.1 hypothetical protein SAMN05421848_1384 [Kushneria avicenniae]
MRPLDILSITLVLCGMALVIALPMADKVTLSNQQSVEQRSATLHYPGQQRQTSALWQFEGEQGQSRPTLFDPDRSSDGARLMQSVPGVLHAPETPAPTMGMRYPAGRQIYSF